MNGPDVTVVDPTAARVEPAESAAQWARGFPHRLWRHIMTAPVALLLLAGFAVGPEGVNLLSASVLASLGPLVPVAIAALGVIVGMGAGDRHTERPRLFAAAAVESALTASTGTTAPNSVARTPAGRGSSGLPRGNASEVAAQMPQAAATV